MYNLKKSIFVIFFILTLFFLQTVNADQVWQKLNSGMRDSDIYSISVFAGDDKFVLAAGLSSVNFSVNGGRFWQKIFSLEAEQGSVNFVTFDLSNPQLIYVATNKGLFISRDQGKSWQNIFRRIRETANNINWISLDVNSPEKIYIGSDEDLYLSRDRGITWYKITISLACSQVRAFAVHPENGQVLYLANTYGLFKSIDGGSIWKRIFLTSYKSDEEDSAENDQEEDVIEDENQNLINCVSISKDRPRKIYLATGDGVFFSADAGETWSKLPEQGLSCDYVNFLAVSSHKEEVVYVATQGGVFRFIPDLNRWQQLYRGMTAREIRSLALTSQKELIAATDRGVFKTGKAKFAQKIEKEETVELKEKAQVNKNDEDVKQKYIEQAIREIRAKEPGIREVQEAALRYAEVVHPDNIKALRTSARIKALLPDVSLDYDKTVYGSSSTKVGYVGPRDWGFSLSWDIGDLIFSEQVRLINSNARLMVQLRDNILNEVTRLYYERRKLQSELIINPPKSFTEKYDKTLRLEELTANLDALTGNYFSCHLKK